MAIGEVVEPGSTKNPAPVSLGRLGGVSPYFQAVRLIILITFFDNSYFGFIHFYLTHPIKSPPYSGEDFEDYMIKGFYPRIYDQSLGSQKWRSDCIQTYLEKDVRPLSNVIDLQRFQQFLKLCAGHVGQLVNFS